MNHCSVQLWYNKQRVKKNGEVSLYLQIGVGSEFDEIKLPLSWPVTHFDWKSRTILPRRKDDPDYNTYVGYIEREREKYWSVVRKLINRGLEFSLSDIYKGVNISRSGYKLCDFMRVHILVRQRSTAKRKDRIKSSTARNHTITLDQVKDFVGDNDPYLTTINDDWLEAFANWLRPDMVENSVYSKIAHVRSYLSYAERNGIAVHPDYRRFDISQRFDEATFLEDYELQSLFDLYAKHKLKGELQKVLRAFLFACCTGLRISDLTRFNKDWIERDNIVFVQQKTRISDPNPRVVTVPIMPIAKGFINELKGETLEVIQMQPFNRYLKDIALEAGIRKNLTSHVARHTFATWMTMCGVPVHILSEILGHASVDMTRKYTHIVEGVKARAMMMLNKQFMGFMPETI